MSRTGSVDVIRLIAIFAVIVIHTEPFNHSALPGSVFDAGLVINQLARFAVPCFFILSGFFWARKFGETESPLPPSRKMAQRIATLLICWSLIYLLPTNIEQVAKAGFAGIPALMHDRIAELLARPVTLLLQSTKAHLWFLVSLLWCVAISAVMLELKLRSGLIALALILFTVGLMGGAYADTPIGFHIHFNFREGPFFGLVFFVTGYVLQRIGPRTSWLPYGLAITAAGAILQLLEIQLLHHYWASNMWHDFVAATWLYGLGVAMIGLSGTRLLDAPALSRIGPLVLGIYAIHAIFVDVLKIADERFASSFWWNCAYPVAVFLLSTLAAFVLSRYRVSRRLVT
ncbi:acyltransferase [Uliginosibacterium sp. H3]|uniref:Acyltransferase n=1 Tax=Uliginosibacterium silvisoli TaxID=3114758 RepID=A0ABU6JZN6_9RHOO|nr:acyltransferase [Uliginosibacterium sp. H3]